jgi:hypothetical protein
MLHHALSVRICLRRIPGYQLVIDKHAAHRGTSGAPLLRSIKFVLAQGLKSLY